MPRDVFQSREDTACTTCGGDLSWLKLVHQDGTETWFKDCRSCQWYEAGALFTWPIEAYRAKCRDDDDAEEWAGRVIAWAQDEAATREDKRRHDTIAKIKELAGAVGVSVTINGKRGRPPKGKENAGSARPAK